MRKAAGVVAVASAWIYTAAHFYFSGIRQPLANFYGDFLASFPSWRLSVLLGRLDLYNGSLASNWALMFGDKHPLWHYGPVEHLVTLPLFAFSDLRSAYTAWLIANYAFVIAILALAVGVFHSGRTRWVWASVVVIAVLNYGPFYEALTQRTIEIFELLLIFAAYALLLHGRSTASGIAIGLAAMTKFLPLIFLPYFVVKRRFRELASSLIVIALIAIATEAVFGWRDSGIIVQLRRGGSIKSQLDQSLAGMILRLLVWTRSSLSTAMVSRGAIVIALIALSWLFLRARNCATIADLEWSTLIVSMVLLPPHNQQYYFVLLLFPYLALAARELRPAVRPHRARRWWLAISFILTGTVVPLSLISRLAGTNIFSMYLALGIPFVGAAILAAICIRAVLAECASLNTGDAIPGTPHAV
jgi:hypothetical protein